MYDECLVISMSWVVAKQLVLAAVVVYVGLVVFLFFAQSGMTYFPSPGSFNECASFSSEEQVVLNEARLYVSGSSSDYLVVYHGNAGRACDRAHLRRFSNRTLVILEYPGYGGDERRPSEKRIKAAVEEVASWLVQRDPSSVVVLGESLGSASAAYHSTLADVDKVLLVSPFEELSQVARHHYGFLPVSWLLREEYPTKQYLEGFSGEVLVVHGAEDSVIPVWMSESLGDRRVVVEGAGHNDLYSYLPARAAIEEFLE